MKYSDQQLAQKLSDFRKLPRETEWLEFKEAKRTFSFQELGKYFSALSNEAQLQSVDCGWFILGVENKNKKIVGTAYRQGCSIDELKHDIAQHVTGNLSFIEIYELTLSEGRVLMFQIPSAPQGIPIAWQGHFYGRDGESLVALNIHELDTIRGASHDWSEEICEGATLGDLSPQAIDFARVEFNKKNPSIVEEIKNWDDITFLNKAKLTVKNKITKTAVLLLGKPESTSFLSPHLARITWIVKDNKNQELDYYHIEPPFVLASHSLQERIRNLKYRYMPDASLFPEELTKYDPWVLREALHNCIAHQDYALKAKITVVENPDELVFSNAGHFIPGTIENVIKDDSPPKRYRNPFLIAAMANVNMIDTIGSGIKRMFTRQRERLFPMPSYDLSRNEVTVRILGKILNPEFTKLLKGRPDLDLDAVILLDDVQKGKRIPKQAHKFLKAAGLVEGRYPSLHLSFGVHAVTGGREDYIKKRGFDNDYYEQLVIEYLKKFKQAGRDDIDKLLLDKLPDVLTLEKKRNKIHNLLYDLSRKRKIIVNQGTNRFPIWALRILDKIS